MTGTGSTATMGRRDFLKAGGTAAGVALAGAALLADGKKAAAQEGTKKESKYTFLIDLRRCSGCEACVVACKTENGIPVGKWRTGVKFLESGTYPNTRKTIVPWLCNHCEKPRCIKRCPADPVKKPWGAEVAATYKRPDGVVVIDQDRCMGCGMCVMDCPYGVRFMDPFVEAGGSPGEHAANKCDLCLARIRNGVVPSCVNTCPAGARRIIDLNNPEDPGNKILEENAGRLKKLMESHGTEPSVMYIDPSGMLDETFTKSDDVKNTMNKEIG
ncbi:MAG: 4Fe-4S dicluster domain-containing protein [Planctomycetes bacterium]|nr:4Fe-4S dicluster domain-containing protein [Planctomycetota bacterium]